MFHFARSGPASGFTNAASELSLDFVAALGMKEPPARIEGFVQATLSGRGCPQMPSSVDVKSGCGGETLLASRLGEGRPNLKKLRLV
jgi:hypothetical protein